MGMFIRLEVDQSLCDVGDGCDKCVAVCPVDIFRLEDSRLVVNPENEDECTLCDLCLEACPPNALRLVKVYEEA